MWDVSVHRMLGDAHVAGLPVRPSGHEKGNSEVLRDRAPFIIDECYLPTTQRP